MSHCYTALANTEPLLLEGVTGLASCKPQVTTFLSTDQNITLFYVCFCLKVSYLIYIADLLTLTSWPAAFSFMSA